MSKLLSKKDLFVLNSNINHLCCPICGTKFIKNDYSLTCQQNHTYDINNKGFVKLLKKSKIYDDKFYTKDLFLSRRRVINNGYYDLLHSEISNIINKKFKKPVELLEIGAGEGTHSAKISHLIEYENFYLTDLNQIASSLATDYLQEGLSVVLCDAYNLPFKKSFDIVLDILSPFNTTQINKVLKDNGIFIKVVPTNSYLKEIRQKNNIKEYQSETEVKSNFENNFNLLEIFTIEKTFSLSEKDSQDFLQMTPLTKHIKNMKNVDKLTISLNILVGGKK